MQPAPLIPTMVLVLTIVGCIGWILFVASCFLIHWLAEELQDACRRNVETAKEWKQTAKDLVAAAEKIIALRAQLRSSQK